MNRKTVENDLSETEVTGNIARFLGSVFATSAGMCFTIAIGEYSTRDNTSTMFGGMLGATSLGVSVYMFSTARHQSLIAAELQGALATAALNEAAQPEVSEIAPILGSES